MSNPWLPFDDPDTSIEARIDARDRAGRERAVDPAYNVALEASAGTGKTRVLVDRYINLLRAGVDPSSILAITFTRKAAAEMRERIVATLRAAASRGEIPAHRWRELRDRLGDIAISTIDAFCLSLLREFPLEADVDPGFAMADETEVPRLVEEALDRALRICRQIAREDEDVVLVFAQLGERRARGGLAALLNRRIVAPAVLRRYLASGPRDLRVDTACRRAARAMHDLLAGIPGGPDRFLDTGPLDPAFDVIKRDVRRLDECCRDNLALDPAFVQAVFARLRDHFLTLEGTPRKQLAYSKAQFASEREFRGHRELVAEHADAVLNVLTAYRRDLNVIVSRGVSRMFEIAQSEYRKTLDAHAVLDFSDVLLRALDLLRQMDEFAQSRYRLESRYHHILVDELQDTSRAQWELVSLLVQSWGEGFGLAHSGPLQPSIFIVGDRKQSIYGFRDADVSVLEEASRYLECLRPDGDVRRSISRSFRSVPALLSFVNDLCEAVEKAPSRRDGFRYDEQDRFPIDSDIAPERSDVLGVIAAETPEACAERTAAEIERLLAEGIVRDRDTGVPRRARPADIAILFRTRESHRQFEDALEHRGIPAYVFKGLGFFDADEIKDALALLWYLADPLSDLRAAAWLRSRFIGLTDEAIRRLAPRLADALHLPQRPARAGDLDPRDARLLDMARESSARWRALVDRLPPAEVLDVVLTESAYTLEMRGRRLPQARENLKKLRGLVRRIQNRGYATLGRIAAHLDRLSVGDESNAVVDALDAVNLLTVHASKGLEFPIVFVVNLARGTGNRRDPVRVTDEGTAAVSVGDFQSDADEDWSAREREETKRLLYVALTRARDRLYLGSVVKDGRVQPGRGSLAEVLPPSLVAMISESANVTDGEVTWRSLSGVTHRFRVAPADESNPSQGGPGPAPHGNDDFAPLVPSEPPRHSIVQALAAQDSTELRDMTTCAPDGERLIGTLVHRMLEKHGLDARQELFGSTIPGLLRVDELVAPEELPALTTRVADAYRAVSSRADVRALCAQSTRLHEVPFTMHTDRGVLRGSIDCLVHRPDGGLTILEFKTGRARPEHGAQLELYKRAAERLFPAASVDALLVYADEAAL